MLEKNEQNGNFTICMNRCNFSNPSLDEKVFKIFEKTFNVA